MNVLFSVRWAQIAVFDDAPNIKKLCQMTWNHVLMLGLRKVWL